MWALALSSSRLGRGKAEEQGWRAKKGAYDSTDCSQFRAKERPSSRGVGEIAGDRYVS